MCTKSLPGFLRAFLVVTGLIGAMLCGISAHAQTPQYIFPGSNPTYTGGANSWPMNATPTSGSNMCQWLYLNGDFAPVPSGGLNITVVYVKPTTTTTFTYSNLQIKLGNTSLTTLTSGTWNAGLTTVYFSTSVSLSSSANGWLQFTLQTPFFYSGGGIIFELSQQSATSSGMTLNQFTVTGRTGRMYGSTSGTTGTADAATAVFGFDAAPANCSGTPLAPTITTTAFPAATPLCAGSTTVITATNPNLGNGIVLQWQSAPAATGPWTNVVGGSGATTLNYTTGPISVNTYFRMGVTCTNSNITTYSNVFLVPVGSPQPGIITGASTYCPGDPELYSVPPISGGTFAWTLPAGWSGFSTSNSILVTPGPGTAPGTISVTVTTPCGPASIARTRSIVPGSAPGPPGTIAGNSHICGGTQQTYSVLAVGGASSYVWTLPSGWTGASSTNSINVTTNNTSGSITVKALNGCGQSSLNILPVTVISALANPGTITGQDTVCSGALHTYSINPVPGATSYTWSLPSGWSGTTTGTSIQAFAGTGSGPLTVTAYVSCATSPISTKPLTVVTTVNPAVTISVPPAVLCQGTPITITAAPSFPGTSPSYQWRKNGVVVAAFGTTYTTNNLAKGDSVSVTMTSNASCAANTTAVSNTLLPNITSSVMPGVSINTVPPINLCKGTPVTFTTTSAGTGPTPSYQWFKNGSAITGANGTSHTDVALNNADTLSVQMTTSAVCAITPIAMSNKVGIRVTNPATPTVSISAAPSDVVTPGQPVTFTSTQSDGGTTPDYQWQKNGVNIAFETGDTYTTSTLKPGDHISVKMLSYADCVEPGLVTSNIIVMKSALGVGTAQQVAGDIRIHPNPNSGRFTVAATSWNAAYSGRQVRVDVLSSVGQSVYHLELAPSGTDWKTQVSLGSELANGRYMLRVSTEDGTFRTTLPFILNR